MLSDKCILCFEVGNEKNDDGICAQCSKILNELGYEKSFKKNVSTIHNLSESNIIFADDGSIIDDDGCHYESLENYYQTGFFGFCGCGDATENLILIYDGLELISSLNASKLDNRYKIFQKSMYDTFGNAQTRDFFEFWCDKEGLTEHGSTLPGWLTKKGKKVLNDLLRVKKEKLFKEGIIIYRGQKIDVWNKEYEPLDAVSVNYVVLDEIIEYMNHLQKMVDAGGYEKTLFLVEVVQDFNNTAAKCYLAFNQEDNCDKVWTSKEKDILFDLECRTNPKYLEKYYELLARNGGNRSGITIDFKVIEIETELHGNYL